MNLSKNKKILMIIRYYYPHLGGNENQAKLLAEYLANTSKADITVVTSLYNSKLAKHQKVNNVNINRLYTLKIKKSIKVPKILNYLLFLIQEYSFIISLYLYLRKNIKKYDIVHVHQSTWLCLIPTYLAKKSNIPIVIKEATLNGFKYLKYLLIPQFIKYYVIKNAEFIAISTMIEKNLIKQGMDKKRITLIPNAINVDKFKKFNELLYNNENVILYVGNFSQGYIKGLDILLKAIALLKEKYPNIKLRIIGDGNINKYMKIINKEKLNENIEILGQQKDVQNYYLNAKIFVLPSRSEGMSNSLLEAMASGMPCVATRVSGVEDIIKDSENGYIVENQDYVAMSQKIINIIEDRELLTKFHIESRKASKKFDISLIAEKYINLYDKLKK